jgi:hypothetical protein
VAVYTASANRQRSTRPHPGSQCISPGDSTAILGSDYGAAISGSPTSGTEMQDTRAFALQDCGNSLPAPSALSIARFRKLCHNLTCCAPPHSGSLQGWSRAMFCPSLNLRHQVVLVPEPTGTRRDFDPVSGSSLGNIFGTMA